VECTFTDVYVPSRRLLRHALQTLRNARSPVQGQEHRGSTLTSRWKTAAEFFKARADDCAWHRCRT
jgi:hypothetical protein